MPLSPLEIATAHQNARTKLATAGTVKALRLWKQVNPQELDAGWDMIYPELLSVVTAAQVRAAQQADPYSGKIASYYGAGDPTGIVPQSFGGVTLDGRELGPAMFGAVTTTKKATTTLGAGRAFEAGASFLATVVGAAIQDMGRQADITSAVGKGWTMYVRVVSPGACDRCAVLAGKGEARVAFKRHPRCKCTSWPTEGDDSSPVPQGLFASPTEHFDSLSKAEQDRIYTKAGAEAIRNGADPISVVNARRGAYGISYSGHYNIPTSGRRLRPKTIGYKADGSPLQVYVTDEGTTRRGAFGSANFAGPGRRSSTLRLMPEQIAVMAGGDKARWVELLRKYGYLQ